MLLTQLRAYEFVPTELNGVASQAIIDKEEPARLEVDFFHLARLYGESRCNSRLDDRHRLHEDLTIVRIGCLLDQRVVRTAARRYTGGVESVVQSTYYIAAYQ